ncbi:concanavalin A-like lectin/glucanase domain-containing protein [Diplogelasinospora grovesii]|uniref:Concanavalin A-like lectin/glucanase domain-containing protein n=1 Tax=Diplogelasinospora grovesii TaxID=303347 RepID=A0AAN6NCP7_9PEZI|nr:concanavalin A-like lectin/glucanase domain-containing protein [Diplogelasinospora grovesii]
MLETPRYIMSLPTSLSSLIILISVATAPLAVSGASLTDDAHCGCYLTNGTQAGFFSNHKFYDFRNLPQYAGVPGSVANPNDAANAGVSSQYFNDENWTSVWSIQNWNNSNGARSDASVLMVNSPSNVYIEANGDPNPTSQTWLTLRTQRLPGQSSNQSSGFQSAAEIESVSSGFQFLSMRMLARTVGGSGAITAMFTYRGSDTLANVQEADLEIRTHDPHNLIHYTNQPSYTTDGQTIDQATENATLPDGLSWANWAVHRLDWTPTSSTWYVDGFMVANISFQTPRDPSKVILNAWSDGGQWTGNMSVGDAAYMQIQWFEIVYNSTDAKSKRDDNGPYGRLPLTMTRRDASTGQCRAVCSIDETSDQGQPVMLWASGAQPRNVAGGWAVWVPSVLTGLVLFAMSAGLLR